MEISVDDRVRGALIGLACGDAVGTSLEKSPYPPTNPINDLIGGGPLRLEAGEWTDDTSMALLLAESLLACGAFNPKDQLQRYLRWYRDGHLGVTFQCVDIGIQTRTAVLKYEKENVPFASSPDEIRSGNGSLMRIAPIAMAYYQCEPHVLMNAGALSSQTTHGSRLCLDACRYFVALLAGAFKGASKEELLDERFYETFSSEYASQHPLCPEVADVVRGSYKVKEPPVIEGSGLVTKTLEAALWAFYRTNNFKDGCLLVANLGHDADTTSAVYGQIAGAFYGESGIPEDWKKKIAWYPYIYAAATELARLGAMHEIIPPAENYDAVELGSSQEVYKPVGVGLEPGPKSFKTIGELDHQLAYARERYEKEAPGCPAKAFLWQEFENRLVMRKKKDFAARIQRPRINLVFSVK